MPTPNAGSGVDPVAEFVLDPRFNGPVGWANGGYACGVIASADAAERSPGTTVEVTLRRPVPLGRPLQLVRTGDGGGEVWHGDELVAITAPTTLRSVPPPLTPDRAAARLARDRHPGWPADGPLADCFVCSTRRPDGLQVTAGPLGGHPDVTATPFDPADCTTEIATDGVLAPEFVWAALDCPSFPADALLAGRICLLGTYAVEISREIGVTEPLVVVGWVLEQQRRVYRTASALLDDGGTVIATARATWVQLKDQNPAAG